MAQLTTALFILAAFLYAVTQHDPTLIQHLQNR